jgi:hypothetical protein
MGCEPPTKRFLEDRYKLVHGVGDTCSMRYAPICAPTMRNCRGSRTLLESQEKFGGGCIDDSAGTKRTAEHDEFLRVRFRCMEPCASPAACIKIMISNHELVKYCVYRLIHCSPEVILKA